MLIGEQNQKHIFPKEEKLVLSLKPPKAKQQFKAYTVAKN